MNIPKILLGNQFDLVTSEDKKILAKAVTKAFQVEFGPSLGKQVSFLISDNVGKSWDDILSNYPLLEDSLRQIFQEGAKEILDGIHSEITKNISYQEFSQQTTRAILEYVRLRQVFSILKKLDKNQHPILLFTNEKFRDKVVKEFFQTDIPNDSKGYFSESVKVTDKKMITYDEIITENQISPKKINKFLNEVHQQNKTELPSRFACENTIWFKEQGLFEEHQDMGTNLDSQVVTQSCILCCYNLNKLENEHIQRIINSRGMIILKTPLSIYLRKN